MSNTLLPQKPACETKLRRRPHVRTAIVAFLTFDVRLIAAMFQSWPLFRKQKPIPADLFKENIGKVLS